MHNVSLTLIGIVGAAVIGAAVLARKAFKDFKKESAEMDREHEAAVAEMRRKAKAEEAMCKAESEKFERQRESFARVSEELNKLFARRRAGEEISFEEIQAAMNAA